MSLKYPIVKLKLLHRKRSYLVPDMLITSLSTIVGFIMYKIPSRFQKLTLTLVYIITDDYYKDTFLQTAWMEKEISYLLLIYHF